MTIIGKCNQTIDFNKFNHGLFCRNQGNKTSDDWSIQSKSVITMIFACKAVQPSVACMHCMGTVCFVGSLGGYPYLPA